MSRSYAPQDASVTEKILQEVHDIYLRTDADARIPHEPCFKPDKLVPGQEGIMAICSKIGLKCIAPRRKINVMIVGNHSAGKSSYINWYIGEQVQKAAVAIETQVSAFSH